jgi:hypothetical protein
MNDEMILRMSVYGFGLTDWYADELVDEFVDAVSHRHLQTISADHPQSVQAPGRRLHRRPRLTPRGGVISCINDTSTTYGSGSDAPGSATVTCDVQIRVRIERQRNTGLAQPPSTSA